MPRVISASGVTPKISGSGTYPATTLFPSTGLFPGLGIVTAAVLKAVTGVASAVKTLTGTPE